MKYLAAAFIFCCSAVFAVTPYSPPSTDTVMFNRTNKQVLPNGLKQIFDTISLTNFVFKEVTITNIVQDRLIFDTVADLVSYPFPINGITAIVNGRTTKTNGGGGEFYFVSSSTATTNLGTIFPSVSSGRWFRMFSGATNDFNALWFGAMCDKVTDDSSAIRAAVAAMPYGGNLTIPAGAYFSDIVITQNNLTINGGGAVKDYVSGIATNSAWLPSSTNFMFRVGDSTNLVRGFKLQNATLYSKGAGGGYGLWMNTVHEAVLDTVSIWNFYYCLYGLPSGGLPSTLVDVYSFIGQATSDTGSRVIKLKGVDDGANEYLTGWNFYGGHINGQSSGTNTKAVEIDGCAPYFDGTYFDLHNSGTHSIFIDWQSYPNTSTPYLIMSGAKLDGGVGTVVIELSTNVIGGGSTYPFNRIHGWPETTGKIQMQNGSTYSLPVWSGFGQFYEPVIDERLLFNPSGVYSNDASAYIYSTSLRVLNIYGTNGVHIETPSFIGLYGDAGTVISNSLSIYNGHILIDNNRSIFAKDSGGNYESILSIASNGNVSVAAPTTGGSVQLTARNASGKVQFIIDSQEEWRVIAGSLLPLRTNDIGTALAPAGTGYFTDINLPLTSKLIRANSLGNLEEVLIGSGITFDGTTLSSTVTSGENVGGGVGVYRGISSTNFQFNTLLGTNGITTSSNGNVVVINLAVTNYTVIAITDPSVEAATGKTNYWPISTPMTIKSVTARLLNPSTSGSVTFDLTKNGTTMLSSPVSITSGNTNATATVSVTSATSGDALIGYLTAAGANAAGASLVIGYTVP